MKDTYVFLPFYGCGTWNTERYASFFLVFLYIAIEYREKGWNWPAVEFGSRAPLLPVGAAGLAAGVGVPTEGGTPRLPNGKYGESGG